MNETFCLWETLSPSCIEESGRHPRATSEKHPDRNQRRVAGVGGRVRRSAQSHERDRGVGGKMSGGTGVGEKR